MILWEKNDILKCYQAMFCGNDCMEKG